MRDVELTRGGLGQLTLRIGDGDDLAALVAQEAGQMGGERPGAGAEDADTDTTGGRHVGR